MKQSKTAYLVFALLGIVILIMLIQVFKFSQVPTPTSNQGTPAPVIRFAPPPRLHVVSTNITNQPVAVSGAVAVTFDRPINNEKLALEITPKEKILPLFNSDLTTLTIRPLDTWKFNTSYTIKVLKSTQSQDSQFLDKDYEFSFQTEQFVGI